MSVRRRGGAAIKTVAILLVAVILYFIIFNFQNVFALESGSQNFLNLDSSKDLNYVTEEIDKVLKDVLKDLGPQTLINVNTNIPSVLPSIDIFNTSKALPEPIDLKTVLSPKGVSSKDVMGILVGALTLSIQIFIVVIQIVSDILKGVLGALNG